MRKITVPSGIGDNIWLLQKLVNAGEKFEFILPNNSPQRGKQIFDLLPKVSANASYGKKIAYEKIARNNIQNTKNNWKDITEEAFTLSANKHLEDGKRIEDFLPDLATSFKIDWNTGEFKKEAADTLPASGKYIGIYASKYATVDAWKAWKEDRWMDLIEMIRAKDPTYIFVVIGAEYDMDLGKNLLANLEARQIPYVNTIGQPLGMVIEIMKRLHYLFSFPSGIGILAPTVGCPVTMFYPPHLIKMMTAWASPEDIESGQYKGCQFCEPQQIFDWCIENGKL